MNEIEKLYENAGIEKKIMCDWTCNCGSKFSDNCNVHCLHYEDNNLYYPPFTAEKQLELIKLLTQRCDLTISQFSEWEFIHFDGQEPIETSTKEFDRSLAQVINARWQDLTEEEKEQIRGILK